MTTIFNDYSSRRAQNYIRYELPSDDERNHGFSVIAVEVKFNEFTGEPYEARQPINVQALEVQLQERIAYHAEQRKILLEQHQEAWQSLEAAQERETALMQLIINDIHETISGHQSY